MTHGVGVTNAMTGLAAASMDGVPLLCLAYTDGSTGVAGLAD
ncbi:MAG TPA: thiamine pyrophosphate-binding protein [Chloroflexota bacterium]|nr:thiamine pyrophosphate-binding protein [Chloroflexota bacterium]